MLLSKRSWRLGGLLAAAIIATGTSAANAGIIVSESSTRDTTYAYPSVMTATSNPGKLYEASGVAVVTTSPGGAITLDFTRCLSPNFRAWTSSVIMGMSTDGKLEVAVHFDTPVSIMANIFEGGVYTKSGSGEVSVRGGEFGMEINTLSGGESRGSDLTVNFEQSGAWTATAATTAFNGTYTDYEIAIDNDLMATATYGSTAAIYKKSFILQIIPVGGDNPPVPEPASLGILGLGVAGMLLRRRR